VRPGYLSDLIGSINRLAFDRLDWVYVDDCSDSPPDLAGLVDDRINLRLIENHQRLGRALNIYNSTRLFEPSSDRVFCLLDADDWLCDPLIFERLADVYRGGWDCVYTNFQTNIGGQKGHSRYISPFASVRSQGFVASHFFTFRATLSPCITYDGLCIDGSPAMLGTDCAINLQVLEGSVRRRYLDECPYVYRVDNPDSLHFQGQSDRRLSSKSQSNAAEYFFSVEPDHEANFEDDIDFINQHLAYFKEGERLNGGSVDRWITPTPE
jgi:hypothetical protein